MATRIWKFERIYQILCVFVFEGDITRFFSFCCKKEIVGHLKGIDKYILLEFYDCFVLVSTMNQILRKN